MPTSPTLAPGMYRLVFLSGRYEGKRLMVRQAVTLVGRKEDCHLVLPDDDQIAPRHARFEERGTGIFLSSISPEHPVERNGAPVLEPVRLAHNDLLVIGRTRIQFQDLIAPQKRLRPSPGLLQPATVLLALAIVAFEIAMLFFLIDWPLRLIRPEIEEADIARAEEIRAANRAENEASTGTVSVVAAPGSVVALPGTAQSPSSPAATNADGTLSAPPAASTSPPPPIVEVLEQADFAPADTNVTVVALPPVSAADPVIEEAQRTLAEAVAAAQFADYAKAFRLLNQIHQNTPGFLPAHVEHARLLEARGDLDAAHQRWTQILGIAPEDSPFRAQALEERRRLAEIQTLQTQIIQNPGTAGEIRQLPRNIRISAPDIQKMPSDIDIAEMRVLNATLELAPDAHLFKDAAVQVFITFYDSATNGQIRATRAITPSSPLVLGNAFADRRSLPVDATYVVPRGLRAQELRETGQSFSYYGYTLHVFAGQILQDAVAKPRKLLDLPIHIPAPPSEP